MTTTTTALEPAPALPRPVVILVGLAAGFLVVAGLRGLSDLVGPVFLALVLTIAAHPIRPRLERLGLPGWAGSLIALLTVYAVLLGLTLALILAGARFATLLPDYQPELNRVFDNSVVWLDGVGIGQGQIDEMRGALDLGQVVQTVGAFATGLLGVFSSLFLVLTLTLFMVFDGAKFPQKLLLMPPRRLGLGSALAGFAAGTRRYLWVSTVFGLIVAVLDTVALVWIGVPVALVWGLLSFITNYIPNVGFVIGVIPPMVIGLLEGGVSMMLAVLISYIVINVVIQSFIQPKVVGDAVSLSGTITMISLVFWAYTLGAIGALMAVPLTLLARAVLVDADPRTTWVRPLFSGAASAKESVREPETVDTPDEPEPPPAGAVSAPAGQTPR